MAFLPAPLLDYRKLIQLWVDKMQKDTARKLYWVGVSSTLLGMALGGLGAALGEEAGEGVIIAGGVFLVGGVVAMTAGARGTSGSGGGIGSPVAAGASDGAGSDSAGSDTGSAGGTPSETGCFTAGTLVTLGDGSRKAIETVHVGDLVLSQREDGGALRAQRVSHIWEHTVQRTLLLNFSNGEQLETTKEHRFRVEGGGFVSAGRVRPGAALNTPANNVVLQG